MRDRHIHGRVTKWSAPEGVNIAGLDNDSVSIVLEAKPIKEQILLGGIFLPVFPLFLFPVGNYHKADTSLVIYLTVSSYEDVAIAPNSMTVSYNGAIYHPVKNEWLSNYTLIKQPIAATRLDTVRLAQVEKSPARYVEVALTYDINTRNAHSFKFHPNGVHVRSRQLSFPEINFTRAKQTFIVTGP